MASRQEVFRAMMSEKKCAVPKRSFFGCSDGARRPETRGASAAVRRKGMRAPSRGVGAPDAGFLPSDSGPRGAAVRLLGRRPAEKGRCGGVRKKVRGRCSIARNFLDGSGRRSPSGGSPGRCLERVHNGVASRGRPIWTRGPGTMICRASTMDAAAPPRYLNSII